MEAVDRRLGSNILNKREGLGRIREDAEGGSMRHRIAQPLDAGSERGPRLTKKIIYGRAHGI